ncbi:serum response factor homolog A [Drosophila serrata]|uniref:serum response factor homolog A n=1 Tax=Drosophila serrata TaxID=7274 RepID=UPI000A1CF39D|nr:serum response factor homolog A [Drosophila serrata]
MKLFVFLVLLSCCLATIHAAPEKKQPRSRNVDNVGQEQDAKLGMPMASGSVASSAGAAAGAAAQVTKDPSSGRLFLKKFLTFKNLFSSNNQPVIPIIITGAGTGTTTGTATSPTVTVTSTGTIPSATGTITTSPTSPTTPTTTAGRFTVRKSYGDEEAGNQEQDQELEQDLNQDEDDEQQQQVQQPAQAYPADLMDEQALQAALAAGAQEYEVVTQPEIQGTGQSKATQSSHINLRRKGARRGQVISVRIPPRYRRYFKNGQKVMLNTGNRPVNKRRVVRKRIPNKRINNKGNMNRRRVNGKKNRKNRNKNRRRITAV